MKNDMFLRHNIYVVSYICDDCISYKQVCSKNDVVKATFHKPRLSNSNIRIIVNFSHSFCCKPENQHHVDLKLHIKVDENNC